MTSRFKLEQRAEALEQQRVQVAQQQFEQAQREQETLQSQLTEVEQFRVNGEIDVTAALEAGVSEETLVAVLEDPSLIEQAKLPPEVITETIEVPREIPETIAPFMTDGVLNVTEALSAGITIQELETLGISREVIRQGALGAEVSDELRAELEIAPEELVEEGTFPVAVGVVVGEEEREVTREIGRDVDRERFREESLDEGATEEQIEIELSVLDNVGVETYNRLNRKFVKAGEVESLAEVVVRFRRALADQGAPPEVVEVEASLLGEVGVEAYNSQNRTFVLPSEDPSINLLGAIRNIKLRADLQSRVDQVDVTIAQVEIPTAVAGTTLTLIQVADRLKTGESTEGISQAIIRQAEAFNTLKDQDFLTVTPEGDFFFIDRPVEAIRAGLQLELARLGVETLPQLRALDRIGVEESITGEIQVDVLKNVQEGKTADLIAAGVPQESITEAEAFLQTHTTIKEGSISNEFLAALPPKLRQEIEEKGLEVMDLSGLTGKQRFEKHKEWGDIPEDAILIDEGPGGVFEWSDSRGRVIFRVPRFRVGDWYFGGRPVTTGTVTAAVEGWGRDLYGLSTSIMAPFVGATATGSAVSPSLASRLRGLPPQAYAAAVGLAIGLSGAQNVQRTLESSNLELPEGARRAVFGQPPPPKVLDRPKIRTPLPDITIPGFPAAAPRLEALPGIDISQGVGEQLFTAANAVLAAEAVIEEEKTKLSSRVAKSIEDILRDYDDAAAKRLLGDAGLTSQGRSALQALINKRALLEAAKRSYIQSLSPEPITTPQIQLTPAITTAFVQQLQAQGLFRTEALAEVQALTEQGLQTYVNTRTDPTPVRALQNVLWEQAGAQTVPITTVVTAPSTATQLLTFPEIASEPITETFLRTFPLTETVTEPRTRTVPITFEAGFAGVSPQVTTTTEALPRPAVTGIVRTLTRVGEAPVRVAPRVLPLPLAIPRFPKAPSPRERVAVTRCWDVNTISRGEHLLFIREISGGMRRRLPRGVFPTRSAALRSGRQLGLQKCTKERVGRRVRFEVEGTLPLEDSELEIREV